MTAIASLLSTTAVALPGVPVAAGGATLAPFPGLAASVVDTAAVAKRQAPAATGNALPAVQGDDDALAWLGVAVGDDAAAGVLVPDVAGAGTRTIAASARATVAGGLQEPVAFTLPGERVAISGRCTAMPVTVAPSLAAVADRKSETLPSTELPDPHTDVEDDASAKLTPSADLPIADPLPSDSLAMAPPLAAPPVPHGVSGNEQQTITASPVGARPTEAAAARRAPDSGPETIGVAQAPISLAPAASAPGGNGSQPPAPVARNVAAQAAPVLVAEPREQHGVAVERFATPARFQAEPATSTPAVHAGRGGSSEVNAPARANSFVRVPASIAASMDDRTPTAVTGATTSLASADMVEIAAEPGTVSQLTGTIAPPSLTIAAALPLVADSALPPAISTERADRMSPTIVAGSTPIPFAVAAPPGGVRVGQPLAQTIAVGVPPSVTNPFTAPRAAIATEAAITALTIPAAPIAPATPLSQSPRGEQAMPPTTTATAVASDRPVTSEKPSAPVTVPLAPPPRAAISDAAPALTPGTARAAQVFAAAIHRALGEQDARQQADPAPALTAPAPALVAGVAAAGSAQAGTIDMRHGSWPAAMIERIASLRDMAAENDTRLRLSPDMLGTIDVSLRRDGDAVQVQISAEQAQTRQLLAEAQPRLAELADARGVKLHLSGASGGSTAQPGSGPGQQAGGGDAPRQHAAPASPFSTRPRSAAERDDAGAHDERIA
jgi:flagellar hook-length control protein FliK